MGDGPFGALPVNFDRGVRGEEKEMGSVQTAIVFACFASGGRMTILSRQEN